MRSRSLTVAVLCRRFTHHQPSTEPRPQGSGRLPVTGLATDSGPLGGSLPISNLERDGHARMLPGRKPAWRTPAQPSSSAMASFSIIWRKRITSTPPCELVRLVSSAARFCSRAASGAPRRLSSRRLMAGSVCASLNRAGRGLLALCDKRACGQHRPRRGSCHSLKSVPARYTRARSGAHCPAVATHGVFSLSVRELRDQV
jgi:hypothetical protein